MTDLSPQQAKRKLLDIEDSLSFLLEEYCLSSGVTTKILSKKIQTILTGLELLHTQYIQSLTNEEALKLSERFYSLFSFMETPTSLKQGYSGYMSLMKISAR